jgi:hypothetical protein
VAALGLLNGFACGGSSGSSGSGGAAGGNTGGGGDGTGGAGGSAGTGSGGAAGTGGSGGTGGSAGIGDTVSCAGQASGTWISMSKTNAPQPAQGAALFWTGTELYASYIFGSGMVHAALYTPCADTWRASPSAPTPRPSFAVPVVSAHELLFFGPELSPPVLVAFDYSQNQQANLSVTGAIASTFPTVVTTGSKLIEWGGGIQRNPNGASSGFDGTQAGAVYDSARDTWSPMTTAGAPSARVAPGVWTGSSFAVWGGHSADSYMKDPYIYDCAQYPDGAGCAEYGDGALYDPARDAWTPISATGAPPPRFNHVLAWTGDRLLVWGGSKKGTMTNTMNDDLDEVPFLDGGLYDPAAKTWTPVAASPATVSTVGYQVFWTGDRLAVGQNYFATGWLYDPHRDSWSALAPPDGLVGCSTPLAQAGALIAFCAVGSPASSVVMLLLPGETAWRVYLMPSGIANNPSVLWTGKHLFLWGGVFPAPPPPTCPPGIGCDGPAPTYSNAGFMLAP